MPLLIPGLNEADAKTFTKRLLKSLKQREDTPSLTQLQILVAQAIGHLPLRETCGECVEISFSHPHQVVKQRTLLCVSVTP